MRSWLLLAVTACGSATPARSPGELVAAGERAWLAGDLPGAITALRAAGDDLRARSLLVQALVLTGQLDDAREVTRWALEDLDVEPTPSLIQLPPQVADTELAQVSPDGAYVATQSFAMAGANQSRIIWRTLTHQAVFQIPSGVVRFGATAGGAMRIANVLRGVADQAIEVYDVTSGKQAWRQPTAHVVSLATDQRGALLSITEAGEVTRWDLATGAKLGTYQVADHGRAFTVSSDGQTAVVGLVLYDLAKGAALATLPPHDPIRTQISADGQLAAAANDSGTVELYDRRGARVRTIEHAGTQIQMLADGTMLGFDGPWITRWDLHTGARLARTVLPDDTQPLRPDLLEVSVGGHAVARRGDRLSIVQLIAPTPIELSRLGGSVAASELAWSADGQTLSAGITNRATGPTPSDEILDWRISGAVAVRPADVDPWPRRLEIDHDHARIPPAHDLARMVRATEPLVAGAIGAHWIVASGASGVIHVWSADTLAAAGELRPALPPTALAVRGDDRTLAVALPNGTIELWDLPSSKRLLALALGHDGWAATSIGNAQLDGALDGTLWGIPEFALPAAAVAVSPSPGLATRALARVPAWTPPQPTAACVPRRRGDNRYKPADIAITDRTIAYCFRSFARVHEPPICFATQVDAPQLALASPLEVPDPPQREPFTAEPAAGGVTVCDPEQHCKPVPVHAVHRPVRKPVDDSDTVEPATDEDELAVSDDGAILAIRHPPTSVVHASPIETWDVATGKQIARFVVQFPVAGAIDPLTSTSIRFLGHTVIAMFEKDFDGTGTLYSAAGRRLARYPAEINTAEPIRFHDHVWLLHGLDVDFTLFDEDTGRVIPSGTHTGDTPDRDGSVGLSADYIATVTGDGTLTIYDREVHRVAQLHTPFCPTRR